MPRSRLKKVTKSVPAATKKKPPSPDKAAAAEQSSPLARESDFASGDHVFHPKFGNGIVKEINGDKLSIEFTGKVTKQIVDYYVKRRAR